MTETIIQNREYKNHVIEIYKDEFCYFNVRIYEIESHGSPVIAEYCRISNEPHALFIGFAFVDGIDYMNRVIRLSND